MDAADAAAKTWRIVIVGGGFAGLCLAIGFERHKVPYQIYEAGPAFSELGAGITFAPNGVNAMNKIHPVIRDEFLKQATSNGYGSGRDIFWDCRDGRTDDAQLIYPLQTHPYRSIHRATFLSILANLLPSEAVRFNKRITKLEQKDGSVELSFDDGTTETASAVVGCDGVRSFVRDVVAPSKREPSYGGIYSYRGLAKMDEAIAEIGEQLATNAQNYVSNGAHVITYPIEGGKVLNIVGCKRDPRGEWPHDKWQVPSSREKMLEDFGHMGLTGRKVISLIPTYDHWAGFDLPTPLLPFYKGRIALTGDAAHCTTPHTGAGASLALEDAYILAGLMRDVTKESDIEVVFQAFDAIRRPRTEKVIQTSRDMADTYEFLNPHAESITSELKTRFTWIWEVDLDEHLQEARQLFQSSLR